MSDLFDHRQVGRAVRHQFEGVLEAGAGHAFHVREHLLARDIGVGAGLTLVRNLLGHGPYGFTDRARRPNWVAADVGLGAQKDICCYPVGEGRD